MIDLNVILDVLQKREPFYEASARLLAAIESGQVEGYVAAHTFQVQIPF
ncbi:MAG: PIN domain-containing protein [Anaerolineae bacterium]